MGKDEGNSSCEIEREGFPFFQQGMLHRPCYGGGRRSLVDPSAAGSLLWHPAVRRLSILSWGRAEHSQYAFKEVRRPRCDDAGAATGAQRTLRICIDQKGTRFFSDVPVAQEMGR